MKRSDINAEINQAIQLFDSIGFKLPPFAFWSVTDWKNNYAQAQEIIKYKLGWDVTDYGQNRFEQSGLLLFTIRNGTLNSSEPYSRTYAEKIMVIKQGQIAPMHFHWKKTEDIINRGGGNLVIVLHLSTDDEQLGEHPIEVSIDGVQKTVLAGQEIILTPGESIFLKPYVYHCFYAEKGTGPVVIGEVSQVNDDEQDNRFYEPIGRFPSIDEDVPPSHLLCFEYEKWIDAARSFR